MLFTIRDYPGYPTNSAATLYRINSLQDIPQEYLGTQVHLFLKDSEGNIHSELLWINCINGMILADYDYEKYKVVAFCDELDL